MYAIIGDSHVGPIVRGLRSSAEVRLQGGPIISAVAACRTFFKETDGGGIEFTFGHVRQNYEKWKAATKSDGLQDFRGRVVVSLGLAGTPLFAEPRMWRRFTLGAATSTARPISSGLLDSIVADMQRPVLAFYKYLIGSGLIACAVEAPPPQERDEMVKELGAQTVIDLDQRYRRPVIEALGRVGVPVIGVKADGGSGLLKEEYWGDNSRHGNASYGRLVAAAVLDVLERRTAKGY